MSINKVSVLGLGYIGLPTAAAIAGSETHVHGVDVNQSVVEKVNAGEIHIQEPGLDELISKAVSDGFIKAATAPVSSDAFIIAVPTPTTVNESATAASKLVPDLKYVFSACEALSGVLKKGDLIILESTCPVGTTDKVRDFLKSKREDLSFPEKGIDEADINIAYCPERVLPGKIIHEIVNNDRIVGGISTKCSARAKELYELFVKGEIHVTDAKTAELAKLSENSFRDVNIAFANELSMICDDIDVNVYYLIKLVNKHPRVNVLTPGCGVGGHCIAVDPWFIVAQAPEKSDLIRTARIVNDAKPEWVTEKVVSAAKEIAVDGDLSGVTVACLGLAFKPDVDDLRESPAIKIYKNLLEKSFKTVAVEPNIESLPDSIQSGELVSLEQAIEQCDICVLLVGHSQFNQGSLANLGDKCFMSFTNIQLDANS